MKVKQRPEDFQVEELTDLTASGEGPHALYRLEKRGWSTPDALAAVRRRWKIEPRRIAFGGLKDRHAVTVQYLTIFHGPGRRFHQPGLALDYLGQVPRAYEAADIRANRFHIMLRHLTDTQVAQALGALDEVRADGVPNYFDDQRFGSVEPGQEFIGRLLIQGRFEDAVRQALTAPYEFDRTTQKREKALLRAHWGDWVRLRRELPHGPGQSLADYLVRRPGDFRGGAARLHPELRGLYLSAYQSHLWNRMLARWIESHCAPEQLVRIDAKLGPMPMWRHLDGEQRGTVAGLRLPLPSARWKPDHADPHLPLARAILAEEGLELGQMQVKGVRELFFSKGERAACCVPANVDAVSADDDLAAGRQKLTLAFELPRGSYATLVVKRITVGD